MLKQSWEGILSNMPYTMYGSITIYIDNKKEYSLWDLLNELFNKENWEGEKVRITIEKIDHEKKKNGIYLKGRYDKCYPSYRRVV